MKKVIMLCAVVLVVLVPVFLFWGCAGDECSTTAAADYYVKLIIDDQEYFLNGGADYIDENNPTVSVSSNEDSISVISQTCGDKDEQPFAFEFSGWLDPNTPGVYLGTYDLTGSDVGFSFIGLLIFEPAPTTFGYTQSEGTITITSFSAVGGDVKGTFDITWVSSSPAPSFGSPLTTVGEFRLLRVSDEHFWKPL
jgi:hypothetical protein